MDQNQARQGIKHIGKVRNILGNTSIETEASIRIEKHLSDMEELFEGDLKKSSAVPDNERLKIQAARAQGGE